jgi:hypothetical protein
MLLLGLAVAGLTACGGSSGTSTAPPPPASTTAGATASATATEPAVSPTASQQTGTPSPPSSAETPSGSACATSQLTVEQTEGQGAAGTEYSGITFRNRSARTCLLQGYPGVSLLDAQRSQMGQPAERVSESDPKVLLGPGQVATASFSVSPAACANGLPPKSAYLRVFPPGQRADLVVPAQVFACAPRIRPVHPGAQITP